MASELAAEGVRSIGTVYAVFSWAITGKAHFISAHILVAITQPHDLA